MSTVARQEAGESALARLLATEERLDRELAEATRAAAARVREAETRAHSRREAAAIELRNAIDATRGRLERERQERLARLEAGTARQVSALSRLDDARIDALADRVVNRVLESIGPGADP